MRHALIQHRFSERDFAGEMDGVCRSGGKLRLADAGKAGEVREGRIESGAVGLPFAAREMVLTWNASTPMGTWLDVRFSVGDGGGGWSGWYEMGVWGKAGREPRRCGDGRFGKLEVDILRAAVPFDRARYRVGFGSSCEATPALRMVSICCSGEGDAGEAEEKPLGGSGHDLAVPWLSQFRREVVQDGEMLKAGVCAPTSLAMVLRHFGCRTSVYEVAKMARDEGAGIYGNWAYMAAAAGEFGMRAWVERHSSWDGLIERLKEGVPPILSIAYGKGTFGDFPERCSEGHLLVLRGWTEDGKLICNDPGVEEEKLGRGVRFSPVELGKAFFGHGGIAIVVEPERG